MYAERSSVRDGDVPGIGANQMGLAPLEFVLSGFVLSGFVLREAGAVCFVERGAVVAVPWVEPFGAAPATWVWRVGDRPVPDRWLVGRSDSDEWCVAGGAADLLGPPR
jgi:hypothetical protein